MAAGHTSPPTPHPPPPPPPSAILSYLLHRDPSGALSSRTVHGVDVRFGISQPDLLGASLSVSPCWKLLVNMSVHLWSTAPALAHPRSTERVLLCQYSSAVRVSKLWLCHLPNIQHYHKSIVLHYAWRRKCFRCWWWNSVDLCLAALFCVL